MRGLSNIVWIVVALLIAMIVLVVIIPLISRAQTAAGLTVSETDWLQCCSNYCGSGQIVGGTVCNVGGKSVPLSELCTALKKTGDACPPTAHPLCRCST